MAHLQGFPACCGAQILTGLYGETAANNYGVGPSARASAIPAEDQFHYFTVAITNPMQHSDKGVVKTLRERGFEPIVAFTGNGGDRLHLWAKGREWKPIARAKGNMKEGLVGCVCANLSHDGPCAFCKSVKAEVRRQLRLKLPRQPAGRGTRRRG